MRTWKRRASKRFRSKPNEGLAIRRDPERTVLRRLRRVAVETEGRAIPQRGAFGRPRYCRRRRLAGQGMVEALSGSYSRSIDRAWPRVLTDSGHGACPAQFRARMRAPRSRRI